MCDSTNTLLVPEPILPPSVIVALIRWDIMEEIQCALQDEPHSLHCPNNKQYVPQKLMQRVMQWVHTSLSTGHPGITRTCALVCNSFWWPTLNDDVAAYVRSSHICAHQGHQDKVRQACWNLYPFRNDHGIIWQLILLLMYLILMALPPF